MALTRITDALSRYYINAIRVVMVLLQVQSTGSWMFSQAMSFLVMSFLYDQFNALYTELSRCVGERGEFSGNFEQFRRRHQAISRSVHEADQFLNISNGAKLRNA